MAMTFGCKRKTAVPSIEYHRLHKFDLLTVLFSSLWFRTCSNPFWEDLVNAHTHSNRKIQEFPEETCTTQQWDYSSGTWNLSYPKFIHKEMSWKTRHLQLTLNPTKMVPDLCWYPQPTSVHCQPLSLPKDLTSFPPVSRWKQTIFWDLCPAHAPWKGRATWGNKMKQTTCFNCHKVNGLIQAHIHI